MLRSKCCTGQLSIKAAEQFPLIYKKFARTILQFRLLPSVLCNRALHVELWLSNSSGWEYSHHSSL